MKFIEKKKDGRRREIYFFGRLLFSYVAHPDSHACEVHGHNNLVPGSVPKSLGVVIWGDENRVEIHPEAVFAGLILIGTRDCPARGCRVVIGSGTTAEGCQIRLMENGSEVVIGEECLISSGVKIWCTDTHSIVSRETGRATNQGRFVRIGRRCWLGMETVILKNTELPEGTVVGMRAVVSHPYDLVPNSAIAGNPARVVKTDVDWDRRRPNEL